MRILSTWMACLALVAGPAWADDYSDGSFSYETVGASSGGCTDCGCEDSCCDTCCDCDRWFLMPQSDCGFNFHGWLNVGIMGNADDPASRFNGPYNAVDLANEFTANQLYFVAEKGLPQCDWGIGGRIDTMFGTDYFLAESIGLEKRPNGTPHWNTGDYGVALPQAYVSIGREDFNVQLGHFYSVVGYEGVMAPSNFFYSKAYSYQFAGPFTHWGGQVNWSPSDAWDFQVGLHNGWDALDTENDRLGAIAKATYHFCRPGTWTSFAITTGDEPNDPGNVGAVTADTTNRTRYSWIVNIPLGCDFEYVFHHWLGHQENGAPGPNKAEWYGIDQYLYYTINDCWKAGARFEWFRDDDGTRVGLNRANNPNKAPFVGNFYSATFGLNWTPTCNLTVRPEVRVDWFDNETARLPYDDGTDDSQFTAGIDAILLF